MSACRHEVLCTVFVCLLYTVAPTGQSPKLVVQFQLPVQPVVKPYIGPGAVVQPVTRPPLAGPYAFSRIPAPVWNKPRVFLTHALQDTWLFTNLSARYGIREGGMGLFVINNTRIIKLVYLRSKLSKAPHNYPLNDAS